jgi:hypothetical protein
MLLDRADEVIEYVGQLHRITVAQLHGVIGSILTPTSAPVTGFGCRPVTDLDTRTAGPAYESRQGTKTRGVGHAYPQALWGIGWR